MHLAGDPVSAFGGVLISNTPIDVDKKKTANEVHESLVFRSVDSAVDSQQEALETVLKAEERIELFC